MIIREYEKNDIEQLVKLWVKVFEDEESFVQSFFQSLPKTGSCVVGMEDGKIIAMTSILTAWEIVHGKEQRKVGYIYAVAVDSDYRGRGFGADISKAAYKKAIELGASVITTMPSGESLYSFYGKTLGMVIGLYRIKNTVLASTIEKAKEIPFQEYCIEREKYLNGKSHLRLTENMSRLLELLCKTYGGGLYRTDYGICCAQIEDNTCIIYDMISENPERTASAVARLLSTKTAEYYLPSRTGEKFIMVNPEAGLSADTFYSIAFE